MPQNVCRQCTFISLSFKHSSTQELQIALLRLRDTQVSYARSLNCDYLRDSLYTKLSTSQSQKRGSPQLKTPLSSSSPKST